MTQCQNNNVQRLQNRDSYETPSCPNLVPTNTLVAATRAQRTIQNAFRQKIEINSFDLGQTIIILKGVPCNVITAAQTLFAGLSRQEIMQIDFYAKESSKELVTEVNQCSNEEIDLFLQKQPPWDNDSQQHPIQVFNNVLAGLETKLLQQYRLLQGTLTQIVKRDWIATLKFNLCTFRSIYDSIYKVSMMRALTCTKEQRNLLKTQPSPIICPRNTSNVSGYLFEMSCSFHGRTGPRTEETNCATGYRHDQEQT
ncbi:MAG: hypothetical protein EZS28_034691 [Streblomastix strix]|uniref:Uncharacterized protein n=1 Tax=Streblomastix strix TaxID=222440 RepID=A0A5J4UHY7_9EUKA|nr:MAG: hypothetical protein EZS28_034691 [Streblomastix strix]